MAACPVVVITWVTSGQHCLGGRPDRCTGTDREAPYRFPGIDRGSHPSNEDHWKSLTQVIMTKRRDPPAEAARGRALSMPDKRQEKRRGGQAQSACATWDAPTSGRSCPRSDTPGGLDTGLGIISLANESSGLVLAWIVYQASRGPMVVDEGRGSGGMRCLSEGLPVRKGARTGKGGG